MLPARRMRRRRRNAGSSLRRASSEQHARNRERAAGRERIEELRRAPVRRSAPAGWPWSPTPLRPAASCAAPATAAAPPWSAIRTRARDALMATSAKIVPRSSHPIDRANGKAAAAAALRSAGTARNPAPVVAIGDMADDQRQHHRRHELHQPEETEIERAAGQGVEVPADGNALRRQTPRPSRCARTSRRRTEDAGAATAEAHRDCASSLRDGSALAGRARRSPPCRSFRPSDYDAVQALADEPAQ